jgi:colicin import membrane protein
LNSTLHSMVDFFSKLVKAGKKPEADPHVAGKTRFASAASTAARVHHKKAKADARRLKAIERKEGAEKRAEERRDAGKHKANAKANAKAKAKKKKAKAKAAARTAAGKKPTTAKK